jgi:hypothetical protein
MESNRIVGIQDNIRFEKRGKRISFASPERIPSKVRRQQIAFFGPNLPLVLANQKMILEEERFFFCDDVGAFVNLIPFYGGVIPLGILLLLWQRGEFVKSCDSCGKTVYLIHVEGSMLSGSHCRLGYCSSCSKEEKYEGGGEALSRYPIFPNSFSGLIKEYPIEIVIPGERQHFDWGKGLAGENKPDIIVKPRVISASFREVLSNLKGEPWND